MLCIFLGTLKKICLNNSTIVWQITSPVRKFSQMLCLRTDTSLRLATLLCLINDPNWMLYLSSEEKLPHLEINNGTTNPKDHVSTFVIYMRLQNFVDAIMCKAFPITLIRNARLWFQTLFARYIWNRWLLPFGGASKVCIKNQIETLKNRSKVLEFDVGPIEPSVPKVSLGFGTTSIRN